MQSLLLHTHPLAHVLLTQAESAVEKMMMNEARSQQGGLGTAMGHGALS